MVKICFEVCFFFEALQLCSVLTDIENSYLQYRYVFLFKRINLFFNWVFHLEKNNFPHRKYRFSKIHGATKERNF